jgi:hypothetical protein
MTAGYDYFWKHALRHAFCVQDTVRYKSQDRNRQAQILQG